MVINNTHIAELLHEHLAYSSVIMFNTAFICVSLITPVVIWVSFHKRLATPINKRSSHISITPPFGGVTFYIILILSISIIQSILEESLGYNIIAAISILFMVGLKDDLIHSTAKAKLTFQLLAGLITAYSSRFRISDPCMGFSFGTFFSVILSIFLVILIINAYNLIDGIDGLAALTGIIVCISYAFIFYSIRDVFFFLLNIITLGTLCAFLKFNLSGRKLKIFMGDCGSLIIGMMIGLYTLRFLAHPISTSFPGHNHGFGYKLLLGSVILFIPLLDTSRIILIRLIKGNNPFKADKNHIHHVLINYGMSHIKASILLSSIQLFVIVAFYQASAVASTTTLFALSTLAFVMTGVIFEILNSRMRKKLEVGI